MGNIYRDGISRLKNNAKVPSAMYMIEGEDFTSSPKTGSFFEIDVYEAITEAISSNLITVCNYTPAEYTVDFQASQTPSVNQIDFTNTSTQTIVLEDTTTRECTFIASDSNPTDIGLGFISVVDGDVPLLEITGGTNTTANIVINGQLESNQTINMGDTWNFNEFPLYVYDPEGDLTNNGFGSITFNRNIDSSNPSEFLIIFDPSTEELEIDTEIQGVSSTIKMGFADTEIIEAGCYTLFESTCDSLVYDKILNSDGTSSFVKYPNQSAVSKGCTDTSTYTQGSVLFASSDGNVTEDNSNFFWNDVSNQLRIGHNSTSSEPNSMFTASRDVAQWTTFAAMSGAASIDSTYAKVRWQKSYDDGVWQEFLSRNDGINGFAFTHETAFPIPGSGAARYSAVHFRTRGSSNSSIAVANRPWYVFHSGSASGSSDYSKQGFTIGMGYTDDNNWLNHRGGTFIRYPEARAGISHVNSHAPDNIAYYNDIGLILRVNSLDIFRGGTLTNVIGADSGAADVAAGVAGIITNQTYTWTDPNGGTFLMIKN